ncbi:MAG TPA: porin [Casimicrobiaceae bacterium]|nr:porin [Casimicrobiaceae bacterium]
MKLRNKLMLAGIAAFGATSVAHADDVSDMKAQMEALQKQLDAVKTQLQNLQEAKRAQEATPAPVPAGGPFVQLKPDSGLTFLVPHGGEVQIYGNFDVSFDYATKGFKSDYGENGGVPLGRNGWEPAISTNLSYIGARGTHPLMTDLAFVWQLEGGIEISATPGTRNTTSNKSDAVNGALFSRNSYIGFKGPEWGAALIGKNETPYKTSTDRLNPFSGMLGDYRVIMGNTGGDNRVEFGLRAAHAIWYESPSWSGFSFKAMYSPGQNRDDTSSIVPSGEPDCSGGNVPGSGATPPLCNDGSFGDLWSISTAYSQGPFYATIAYEQHKNVNRTSDLPNLDPRDIADESALKIGGQYRFAATGTTVDLLWERTKRSLPEDLESQNERERPNAWWLAFTQVLTERDNVSVGWAHAGNTKGGLGVHNTPDDQTSFDNRADMYTIAWRHIIDKTLSFYADWALTVNHADAHYDLGAGGHTVTVDCHDATPMAAFDATTGGVTNTGPHCFAGNKPQGVSVGVDYRF